MRRVDVFYVSFNFNILSHLSQRSETLHYFTSSLGPCVFSSFTRLNMDCAFYLSLSLASLSLDSGSMGG